MTFWVILCDDCGEEVTFDRDKPLGAERLFCKCPGTTWYLTEARRAPAKVERLRIAVDDATLGVGGTDE